MAARAKSSLGTYRGKRDFARTGEPAGDEALPSSSGLRFVIQRHDARRLHYDLRLELDGVFKSWAVTRGPSLNPRDKRLAVEVEDHPLEYGDFEGTIPKGQYGGGTVQIWDRGYWTAEGDAHEGLERGELKFTLAGERLKGSWVLVRMKKDSRGGTRTNWLLIKHRDEHALEGEGDSFLQEPRSVASGRSLGTIAAGKGKRPTPFITATPTGLDVAPAADAAPAPGRAKKSGTAMPAFIEPQLCTLVVRATSAPGWGHEVKFDGYRMQLRVENGIGKLNTRKGLDWSTRFETLVTAASALPDCLLDGEVVALDEQGLPDFAALQTALTDNATGGLIYFAFDLLFIGGEDLRTLPLRERKERLKNLLETTQIQGVRYVDHFETPGEAMLQSACLMHLEGIVSKRLDAPYTSGRRGYWTKAKCRAGQEVVIGGWVSAGGRFRSLLAGVHHDGGLVFVGRVGTGFSAETVRRLMPKLTEVEIPASPFVDDAVPVKKDDVHWARPELVAEIEFAGWSDAGMVRQASFKGLREDRAPDEIVGEGRPGTIKLKVQTPASKAKIVGDLDVMGVSISSPDKPLWPDEDPPVTKADLARYYEAVGDWLIEHIKGRPCSVVRAPDGIGAETFFQRHAMPGSSELFELVTVSGDRKPYLQIDRVQGLAVIAQFGGVELHPWNCQSGNPDLPGRLIFDLDPAPEVPFGLVIEAAVMLRKRLDSFGLRAFCKTTGGKGLHVVAPLASDAGSPDWWAAKTFAQEVCRRLALEHPDRFTMSMAKKARPGRIYLDYLRNDRMATAVAPLSPRARAGATVSMPLDWPQVRAGLDPKKFTMRTAPALLRKNRPWKDYAGSAKPLRQAIELLLQSG